MEDYSIQNSGTGECCLTHRAFAPGEEFVSVLFELNGNFVKKEYSMEAWKEQKPENFHAMWISRMPVPQSEAKRSRTAVNDLLLAMFDQLRTQCEAPDKLYVLSLLLVRRRIMRIDDQFDENTPNQLRLYSPFRDEYYQIPAVSPNVQRQTEIQAELTEILTGNVSNVSKKSAAAGEFGDGELTFPDPDKIEFPELDLSEMELPE
ncbi:MAG: hypothetical protein IJD43_06900 [Thermoguttaceae bacterium]|nr:hypothetical protein [Thermoguttaceae bacterium]